MHSTQHAFRILVVEDEPDIREMLVACLSSEAEVEGAADGQEALELLARGPRPSVILLDLRMPRLSGEGLLRALDHDPLRPPVVTMSACTHQAPRDPPPTWTSPSPSTMPSRCCAACVGRRGSHPRRPGTATARSTPNPHANLLPASPDR